MQRLRRLSVVAFVFCLLPAVAAFGLEEEGRHTSQFVMSEYREWVAHLASDEMEGRGTGQEGIDKAADYIAQVFKQYGVEPAGDDGTYFQNFPLQMSSEIGEATRLTFGRDGRRFRELATCNEEFVPFSFSGSGAFEGEVVFAGYGIADGDGAYNDYKGIDVTDKVVLMIRRGPGFREFGTRDHLTFRAKANRANARDAAAILIVNQHEGSDELYNFGGGRGGGGFSSRSYGVPMMHISKELADRMLKAGGLPTVKQLQAKIDKEKAPMSAVLEGVTVKGRVEITPVETNCKNVVGIIPGSGPQKDEIIVVGGHYDHLGIRNKGEADFDPTRDISNGADDNASGTAIVMNVGKAYTQGAKPNRSILLILFSAEELGLHGSRYYAKNPTVDIEKCVAMLNFDMVGRLNDSNLEVGGMRTGDFEDLVYRTAEKYNLTISDGGGGRGPSDHTNFYNEDVPVMFFFTGLHPDYHRPGDDTHLVNFKGAMRIGKFVSEIIDDIDAAEQRPVFSPDTRSARIARQPRNRRRGQQAAEAVSSEPRRGVRLGVTPGDESGSGVVIGTVADDSPAAKAKMKPGDRIVRIGKKDVGSLEDAVSALAEMKQDSIATIRVIRAGSPVDLEVVFGNPRKAITKADSSVASAARQAVRDLAAKAGGDSDVTTKMSGDTIEMSIRLEGNGDVGEVLEHLITAVGALTRATAEDMQVEVESNMKIGADGSFVSEISISVKAKTSGESAPAKAASAASHGHGAVAVDEDAPPPMPPVRLGIMPTYGPGDGNSYEITGVLDGGPAAKAGMRDKDRIYKIGKRKVTNIEDYMEALQSFKPGQTIPVTVIRDGKHVELKVKVESSGAREAA